MLRARDGRRLGCREVQRFGCGAWMTFVADDAAQDGGRRLSRDRTGRGPQLGKPGCRVGGRRTSTGCDLLLEENTPYPDNQPWNRYSSSSRRPMIIFWISAVPSPMSSI